MTTEPREGGKSREMINATMDSTLWNDFVLRDDDIIIDTWAKSGTTLTQQIVGQLIFNGDPEIAGDEISPWLERKSPRGDVRKLLDRQAHRRFIKSHLPAEALPITAPAKFLYIGRDVRDVIWSWHNHAANFTDTARARQHEVADGHPVPPPPNPDIRAFYHAFLDDEPGALLQPFWPHVRGWWELRDRPNVLLLHFNDLIGDLPAQVRRIAGFLGISIQEERFPAIVSHCSLQHMRRLAAQRGHMDMVWKGGADTFFNKGVNGRWRERLSAAEIKKADEIAARELPVECAKWLRTGER